MSDIQTLLNDYTFRTVLLGTVVLGAGSGILGSFALLRRQSLLGDAISHAALPGIALAFLIVGVKDNLYLLLGAMISGLFGAFLIQGIIRNTVLKSDAALGLILSVFFGFGILLLTYIQKLPNANQAGLDTYLFGQAATLMEKDVWVLCAYTFAALVIVLLFWKSIKLFLFDSEFGQSLGVQTRNMELLTTGLIVGIIALGLQTVGVVLMSALLLAPAAAARQWTERLEQMLWLSALFGGSAGFIGTVVSVIGEQLSTGPVIVLVASIFVLISFIFSPKRGILFRQIRRYRSRRDLALRSTLDLMYKVAITHDDYQHPHSIKLLNQFRGYSKKALKKLVNDQWVELDNNQWKLTPKGMAEAKKYLNTND